MTSRKHRILLIVTSHEKLGESAHKTGFWLEELAAPYVEFSRAGAELDIASPLGGQPPLDARSEADPSASVQAFRSDPSALEKLAHTRRLDEVGEEYDAYFVVGGHGVMWDLANQPALTRLLSRGFDAGKVVAAVCHGVVALLPVTIAGGQRLARGRRLTAFSNAEEKAVGLDGVVPFALETALREQGAVYEAGPLWGSHVVADGRLVTGQNPASSLGVAQRTLSLLRQE